MPIYEYKCVDCGAHLEKRQKVSDELLKICEECGGKLEKQWSLSGFQFKGEGWYVTDYAGKKADKTSGKSEKSEKSEKSSAGESTSKPDSASKDAKTTAPAPAKEKKE